MCVHACTVAWWGKRTWVSWPINSWSPALLATPDSVLFSPCTGSVDRTGGLQWVVMVLIASKEGETLNNWRVQTQHVVWGCRRRLVQADLRKLMFLIIYCFFSAENKWLKTILLGLECVNYIWSNQCDPQADGNKTMSLGPRLKGYLPGSDHRKLRSTLLPTAVHKGSKLYLKVCLTLLIDWTGR